MGTVSTVTIGTDTYYVYALTADPEADGTTWHGGRLGTGSTAWAAATSDNKLKSLVTATDWIDRAVGSMFSGEQTVSSQQREWPRDGATCVGTAVTDGTTPDEIAYATFFLAGQLLVDAEPASGTGTGSNIKQVAAGSANISFFSSTTNTSEDTRLPIVAMDYLKCFFSGNTSSIAAGVASGVSSASSFAADDFKRSEGFA